MLFKDLRRFLSYSYTNCDTRRVLLIRRLKCTMYRDYYLDARVPRIDTERFSLQRLQEV